MTIQTERLELILLTVSQLNLWIYDIPALEKELLCSYQAEPMAGPFLEIVKQQRKAAQEDEAHLCWHSFFLLVRKAGRVVVGSADFKDVPNENGEVEIGYGLGKAFEHRGYMTEAVKAMCAFALRQPGVSHVIAETDLDGEPSQRILMRCGFQKDRQGKTIWWRLSSLEAVRQPGNYIEKSAMQNGNRSLRQDSLAEIMLDQTQRALWEVKNVLDCIPDSLWEKEYCAMPLWKHVYHMLHSLDLWFINPRDSGFQEPSIHQTDFNNLDVPSNGRLTRDEILCYFEQIKNKIESYLSGLRDPDFLEKPKGCEYARFTLMAAQHRHLHTHMGIIMGFLIGETGLWPRVLGLEGEFPQGEYDKYFSLLS